jgi:hypothetical protein
VVVVGGVVVAAGVVTGLVTAGRYCGGDSLACLLGLMLAAAIAAPIMAVGLLIMDAENTIQLVPLDAAAARKLNVTAAERQAYNAELHELSALSAFVAETVGPQGTLEESVAVWSEVKDAVSPEAFSALAKVYSQYLRQ